MFFLFVFGNWSFDILTNSTVDLLVFIYVHVTHFHFKMKEQGKVVLSSVKLYVGLNDEDNVFGLTLDAFESH